MSIKKYSNGSWSNIGYRKYGTSTDTITTLPADVYADGQSATVGVKGNMVQSGTPTPTTPIQPQETGERTGNLFDKTTITTGKWRTTSGETTVGSGAYSAYIAVEADVDYYVTNIVSLPSFNSAVAYDSSKTAIEYLNLPRNSTSGVLHTPNNCAYIIINFTATKADEIMLNTGSTALPYEPYGIKIPISSGGVTTNVYLGGVQSTRRIKKLVLTGQENWISTQIGSQTAYYIILSSYTLSPSTRVCTHLPSSAISSSSAGNVLRFFVSSDFATLEDWQTFLSTQYANGTPVCVWYVIATSTTGIVNEPIRKIGDYADTVSGITIPTITGKDTFDVLTTLKPSEVELTYTGWHDASAKEWDGSEWQ